MTCSGDLGSPVLIMRELQLGGGRDGWKGTLGSGRQVEVQEGQGALFPEAPERVTSSFPGTEDSGARHVHHSCKGFPAVPCPAVAKPLCSR